MGGAGEAVYSGDGVQGLLMDRMCWRLREEQHPQNSTCTARWPPRRGGLPGEQRGGRIRVPVRSKVPLKSPGESDDDGG